MIDAINAGQIPPAFQEDLQSRANELVNTVNCPPPPATETTEEQPDEQKKKKGKQKDVEQTQSAEELVPVPTVTDPDG